MIRCFRKFRLVRAWGDLEYKVNELRYGESYEIIEGLSFVAYQLDLLLELKHVHSVYDTSQLRKYIPDPDPAVVYKTITDHEDPLHEEHPVQILDRRIKQLCNKQISFV